MLCPFRKVITETISETRPQKEVKEEFAECKGRECAAYDQIYNCALLRQKVKLV